MKKLLGIMLVTVCLVAPVFAATVESQNVVGFFKVEIASNAYSLLSVPMQKLTVASGTIDQNLATNEITVTGAGWKPGEFSNMVDSAVVGGVYTELGLSTYYVEITPGGTDAYVGRHFTILDNTDDVLTIDPTEASDVTVGGLNGVGYKIVPANRLRDIFGEPAQSILARGTDPSEGDSVLLWDDGWVTFVCHPANIYMKMSHFGPNYDDFPILRDGAMFIKRLGDATNIVVTGEVSANDREFVIEGDVSYNLLKLQSVTDVAIGSTDLHLSMSWGTDPGAADSLLEWDVVQQRWNTYVYHPGGWWTLMSDFGPDVGSTFILKAGAGYFIKRVQAGNDTATRPTPLP